MPTPYEKLLSQVSGEQIDHQILRELANYIEDLSYWDIMKELKEGTFGKPMSREEYAVYVNEYYTTDEELDALITIIKAED